MIEWSSKQSEDTWEIISDKKASISTSRFNNWITGDRIICPSPKFFLKYRETILYQQETRNKIISICKDSEGYLNVSSLDKVDKFTGETVWVLNREEANEEFIKYINIALSLENDDYNSDNDEIIPTIPLGVAWTHNSYEIIIIHKGCDVYTVEVSEYGHIRESKFVDSPGKALFIRDDWIKKYSCEYGSL